MLITNKRLTQRKGCIKTIKNISYHFQFLFGLLEMNILSFETNFGKCSVALFKGERVFYAESAQQFLQSEELIPLIVSLAHDNGINLATDLDYVACTIGPGSFTGIRIGIAAARGMRQASKHIRLIGISSLEVIARGAKNSVNNFHDYKVIIAVIDAHGGQLYVQRFDNDLNPLSEILVSSREEFIASLKEGELVVGDIEIGGSYKISIDAKIVGEIAKKIIENDKNRDDQLNPVYIKNPSVTLKK